MRRHDELGALRLVADVPLGALSSANVIDATGSSTWAETVIVPETVAPSAGRSVVMPAPRNDSTKMGSVVTTRSPGSRSSVAWMPSPAELGIG